MCLSKSLDPSIYRSIDPSIYLSLSAESKSQRHQCKIKILDRPNRPSLNAPATTKQPSLTSACARISKGKTAAFPK